MRRSGLFVVMSIFVVALFVGAGVCRAEWEVQESGTNDILNDVFFVDENHGWIVGYHSTILATSDGGTTWVRQECPFSDYTLTQVQFLTPQIGYMIGHDWYSENREFISHLFKTENGGETWEVVETELCFHIVSSISFIDGNHGWAMARVWNSERTQTIQYGILKTSDGGSTWDIQFDLYTQESPKNFWYCISISFLDDQHGWALYGPGGELQEPRYILYSEDGGITWDDLGAVPTAQILDKIYPVSYQDVWAVGRGLNFSPDNGKTWLLDDWAYVDPRNGYVDPTKNGTVEDVYPLQGREAFIVTQTKLYYTTDGGVSSELCQDFEYLGKWCDAMAGYGHTVWICGMYGLIARYTLEGVGVEQTKAETPAGFKLTNTPNPFNPFTTISFSLPTDSHTTLTVHDITGRKVATLIDNYMSAGKHSAVFDGSNLASGVYFYRLKTGEVARTGKMLMIK